MVAEIVDFFMRPLLNVDIEQLVRETIDAHDDDIVELVTQQLSEGKTGDDADIEPGYKPSTVKFRKKRGLQTDHVDLKVTGGFYKRTFARREGEGTEVNSAASYAPFLVDKYGEPIFKLNEASKEQLNERMLPTLQTKFNQAVL